MNSNAIAGPIRPSAGQKIHIWICTKLCFQVVLRNTFGEQRLAAINASVNPFIFPVIYYRISLDVHIFVLL